LEKKKKISYKYETEKYRCAEKLKKEYEFRNGLRGYEGFINLIKILFLIFMGRREKKSRRMERGGREKQRYFGKKEKFQLQI